MANANDTRPDGPGPQAPGLDEGDRRIIECLKENGRMSNADIARRLGLGEATVRRRLQRMQSDGLLRVVPIVDPELAGMTTSLFIGVQIEGGRHTDVADAIATLPEVRYVAITTGSFDLLVEAFAAHHQHMAELCIDAIGRIPGVVRTETMTVLRVAKFAFEWEAPAPPPRRAPDSFS